MEKDSINYSEVIMLFALLIFCVYLLVFGCCKYVSLYKYEAKIIDICEIKYNVSDCKIQDLTSDEVIFYDKYNNKYIYEKLENILK